MSNRTILRLALVPLSSLLLSCANMGDAQKPTGLAASSDPCSVVRQLISDHASGFTLLKGAHTRSRYADIWQANYHAIGNSCEIWQAGSKGATRYVCTRAAPDEEVARQYHDRAVAALRGCLDSSWTTVAENREADSGFQTRFEHAGLPTVVLIQGVKAQNVLSPQWTVFYSIGDFRRQ
ncbi:MAG TPA: hypothetical protein VM553_03645 [Dongiaceae bacterium]|nr:hypothetical protein [Dongiaceae bacterium]